MAFVALIAAGLLEFVAALHFLIQGRQGGGQFVRQVCLLVKDGHRATGTSDHISMREVSFAFCHHLFRVSSASTVSKLWETI